MDLSVERWRSGSGRGVFWAFPPDTPLTPGCIALQAEGNGIDFRKVEIQALDPAE